MKVQREMDISFTLEHIVEEVREIKKTIISLSMEKPTKVNKTWRDLISVNDKVTKLWKGPSAVEEIRQQRPEDLMQPQKSGNGEIINGSLRYDITVYDATFVALAQDLGCLLAKRRREQPPLLIKARTTGGFISLVGLD